jgi:hypothetical protein
MEYNSHMNTEQKRLLLTVADKLSMLGYVVNSEIQSAQTDDLCNDLVEKLQEIETELLNIRKVA